MITTRDQLINALANNSTTFLIDKASLANTAAAYSPISFWRSTGYPLQGAIPSTPAICDNTTVGAITFTQQTAPSKAYLGLLITANISSTLACSFEIRDRLAHMGGLSGIVTTAQTVELNLSSFTFENRCKSDYSDVQWFLEWYTATGATVTTATVAVTYDDNSTGNISVSLHASVTAGKMLPIMSAVNGRYIKSVNTVTLSASTGAAGSFGVTATKLITIQQHLGINYPSSFDWSLLGLPEIVNGTCMFITYNIYGVSTGGIRGLLKIVYG